MNTDSEQIATGVGRALGDARVKVTDRRIEVIAGLVVLFVLLASIWQHQQTAELRHTQNQFQKAQQQEEQTQQQLEAAQRAAKANCVLINAGNVKSNGVLTQLSMNINNSKTLSPTQKQQALDSYKNLKFPVVDCSKLASGQ